eukprot:2880869-Rhodomonas_salina.1
MERQTARQRGREEKREREREEQPAVLVTANRLLLHLLLDHLLAQGTLSDKACAHADKACAHVSSACAHVCCDTCAQVDAL